MKGARRNNLRMLSLMDAACGTGTLLGAGERALRRMYAQAGGKDPSLHKQRMENHIYGLDVNGIAGTLTAKRLTDLAADQDYAGSKIAVITDPSWVAHPVGPHRHQHLKGAGVPERDARHWVGWRVCGISRCPPINPVGADESARTVGHARGAYRPLQG